MSTTRGTGSPMVALIGNPNTGKSTLFNALCGGRQRVGNYPGVTVERRTGRMTDGTLQYDVVDLPGTYSLAPRSPDEMVAVDVLLGRRDDMPSPDAVICIVDAANLERNLYLVCQVLELGCPTVLALNMTDVAAERGMRVDAGRLSERLGIPVVPMQANKRRGMDALRAAMRTAVNQPRRVGESPFPQPFVDEVAELETALAASDGVAGNGHWPRYLVERLLLDTSGYLEARIGPRGSIDLHDRLQAARARLAEAGCAVPAVEAAARYDWVARMLTGVVARPDVEPVTWSDRLDRVLTHRALGTLVFAVLMVVMFQSVFAWAVPLMDWIDAGFAWLAETIEAAMPAGALRSLIVDGVIAGVGGVLTFLPQIYILFLFIAVLEDCGYMARAAYLMDRLLSRVGLSGKSFIPLLSSFACAIPGVMATRVIENRRDRLTTILVAPLMSCSARLPVYTVLIAAFIPAERFFGGWIGLQGLTMCAMYLVGIVTAVAVALVLKTTILRGPTPPFIMELPSYKIPSPRIVLGRMFERGTAFVRRAGTLILAVSIVVWAALYYPRDPATVEAPYRDRQQQLAARLAALPADAAETNRAAIEDELAEIDNDIQGAYQRQSWLGRAGRLVEPAVRPLGWDWRIGSAAIASFPAREVVIATLGIIYNLGGDLDLERDEDTTRMQAALRQATWDDADRPVYNVPVALSIMVFFALCAQCAATLAVIRRETNSWRWPLFTFGYMTTLAYLAALVTYQVGIRLMA